MSERLGGRPVAGVLFDYGNTLITVERPQRALRDAYDRIAVRLRRRGHPSPDASVLLRDVHDRVEAEFIAHQRSGALEEMDLVAAAASAYEDLDIRLDQDILDELMTIEQEAWWHGVRVVPGAIAALESLRRAGIRVGLCSNAPYRVRSMHAQLEHVGLREHLDTVTFSAEVGWRKPARQIFDAALRALEVDAAEAVMVGDSMREDIGGARGAGLRAVLYAPGRSAPALADGAADARVDRLSLLPELLAPVGAY